MVGASIYPSPLNDNFLPIASLRSQVILEFELPSGRLGRDRV